MAEAEMMNASTIHEILPVEVFVNILKKLDFKSIVAAKSSCKAWKAIIEEFGLVERASSKLQFRNRIEHSLAFGKNDNIIHYFRGRPVLNSHINRRHKNYEIPLRIRIELFPSFQ